MVASQFIEWNTYNTAIFVVFLAVMLVLFGIAYVGVREGIGILMPFTVILGMTFFGLLGVLTPHRWTVGAEHRQQAFADIRSEYPQLVVYNVSVSGHWAWVRQRSCSNQLAVQVPMHRQPSDKGHYWLTSPTLVVKRPQNHQSFADFNPHDPLVLSSGSPLCALS